MPSRYLIRQFSENNYYHIFNRGVEKRLMFIDKEDYSVFLFYIFIYLMPLENILKKYPDLPLRLQSKNLNKELDIVTYCIMPNHFHFILFQKSKDAISKFMKQITNAYTFYFNKKYNRVGGLVQNAFMSVLIDNNDLLLHVNRYIHINPVVSELVKDINKYKWSSYKDFIGEDSYISCSKEIILSQFSSIENYVKFVADHIDYARKLEGIKHLILE